jgi:hypothetical protein
MENKIYSDLIAAYPTSEALLAFLTSKEGGNLIVRDNRTSPTDPMVIILSKKGVSDMTLPHVPYFRSVIWDTRANRPVCAAPPRGLKCTAEGLEGLGAFIAEEFLDGVMLNMYWDTNLNTWRLASRGNMDAQNTFYSRRPFATLFMEALMAQNLLLNELNRDYTYSWVLQHPEERIVVSTPYGLPRVRIVEMARFLENGVQLVAREPGTFLPAKFRETLPERHALATVEDVKERVAAWGKRFGHQWQGLILKNVGAGEAPKRWKIRTDQYLLARELRGNVAKLPFVWLERWSDNKINQYLRQYPEEEHAANSVIERFKACTQETFDLYQKVYREKAFPLKEAPQKYRKLLWELHQERSGAYFPKLREFMNKQDTARKLWLVNYEVRYATVEEDAVNEPVVNAMANEDFPPLQITRDLQVTRNLEEAVGLAAVAEQEAAEVAEQDAVKEQEAAEQEAMGAEDKDAADL